MAFWGSWCGSDASTGELISSPFEAPRILEIFVSGYPGRPGLDIFLKREDDHAVIPLLIRQDLLPAERWRRLQWWIPTAIRGRRVRLVAVDRATGLGGWLGISTPRRLSILGLLHEQLPSALLTWFVFIRDFALFLLPGFALAQTLAAKRPIHVTHLVVLVIATGATLGYLSFWAFFFSRLLGEIFSVAVYLVSASILVTAVWCKTGIKATSKLVAEPFLYAMLAGLFYVCFFFLFVDPLTTSATHADERFFDQLRPGDNLIPFIFADKIYNRQPLRPFCCGDWLSSDRPPLQSGIFLLERPLLQRPLPWPGSIHLNYELLGVGLQCLWICGVWCLLKALGIAGFRIRQVLGILIFSGFLFYNSVYTWPKLLAAACLLLSFAIVLEVVLAKRGISHFQAAMAATCLGLAVMAHPGSLFSLFAVAAIVIIRFCRLFSLREAALAASVLLAFGAPWAAYQRFVDPPGNRLLKIHFAGEITVDKRSTSQAVVDAYRNRTLRLIAYLKWSNIALLVGRKPLDTLGVGDISIRDGLHIDRAATEYSRIAQREWIWNAVGVVNLGWLAVLLGLFKRKAPPRPAIPFSGWMIATALANMLFWALVTFGPTETVTTHNSYADVLLLSIGLLGFALTFPGSVLFALLALQVFNFFVVWVWPPPHTLGLAPDVVLAPILQVPLLLLGGLITLLLLWHFVRSYLGSRRERSRSRLESSGGQDSIEFLQA